MNTTTQSNDISKQLGALGFSIYCGKPRAPYDTSWKAVEFPVNLYFMDAMVFSAEFKMGTGHFDDTGKLSIERCAELAMKRGITPELSDVMQSLMLDGEAYFSAGTFQQWCQDTGYSDDSIKARRIFDECYRTGKALSESVPSNILDAARFILQDF